MFSLFTSAVELKVGIAIGVHWKQIGEVQRELAIPLVRLKVAIRERRDIFCKSFQADMTLENPSHI
jgi:hypothetical protein